MNKVHNLYKNFPNHYPMMYRFKAMLPGFYYKEFCDKMSVISLKYKVIYCNDDLPNFMDEPLRRNFESLSRNLESLSRNFKSPGHYCESLSHY